MDPRSHKQSFFQLLEKVDVNAVCKSQYAKNYLQHLLNHKEYFVSIYCVVLIKLDELIDKDPGQVSLVDYGCGNGLLGIFARHCGFSHVIFQDTDQEFLEAAEKLCQHLDIASVDFIAGGIGNLHHQPFRLDAVIGTDVIEHIYDLENFFDSIRSLNQRMVTIFTTAANPFNFLLVKRLQKMRVSDEFMGNKGNWGVLGGQQHLPYFEIRKQIISENFPGIEQLDHLSRATRGLAGQDIIEAVKNFKLTNRLPVPVHPSNTCHPVSGSWTERILTSGQYRNLYSKFGFEIDFHAGFYDIFKKGHRMMLTALLNLLIKLLGKTFSPFIIITGRKK